MTFFTSNLYWLPLLTIFFIILALTWRSGPRNEIIPVALFIAVFWPPLAGLFLLFTIAVACRKAFLSWSKTHD